MAKKSQSTAVHQGLTITGTVVKVGENSLGKRMVRVRDNDRGKYYTLYGMKTVGYQLPTVAEGDIVTAQGTMNAASQVKDLADGFSSGYVGDDIVVTGPDGQVVARVSSFNNMLVTNLS